MPTTCTGCTGDMRTVDGCNAPYVNAHRYGQEPWFTGDDRDVEQLTPLPRCADCNVLLGRHHHVNCLYARCAQCGAQAVMCEHNVALE